MSLLDVRLFIPRLLPRGRPFCFCAQDGARCRKHRIQDERSGISRSVSREWETVCGVAAYGKGSFRRTNAIPEELSRGRKSTSVHGR